MQMIDLETKAELEWLLNTYVYSVDRQDFAALRRLYHPDAIDDHGGYKGCVDGLIDWLAEAQSGMNMSSHTLSNMRFVRDGDRAESECRGLTFLSLKGNPGYNVLVVGRHFDKYERREGYWKFSYRSLCVDWVQTYPPGAAALDLAAGAQLGAIGSQDPLYTQLQLLPKFLQEMYGSTGQ